MSSARRAYLDFLPLRRYHAPVLKPVAPSRETKPASSTGRLIVVSLVALALVIRLAPAFVPSENPARTGFWLVGLQALAGTGTLVLAMAMAWRLAGLWAGVVAAALLVFDPLQVIYCKVASPHVLIGLALAIMAAAGLKFLLAEESGGRRSWPWAAVAGAALAAAAYCDWIVLGLVFVTGLAALVAAVLKKRWRLLRGCAIGAAALVVCLVPGVVCSGAAAVQAVAAADWGLLVRHAADMWAPVVPSAGEMTLPAAVGYASLVPAALLALAGLWVLRRRTAVLVWLLAVPVGLTLSHMPFVAGPPDRIAALPLLAVLGGVGLATVLGVGRKEE
jgi:hypothetical protein